MNEIIKSNFISKAKNYCPMSSAADVIADHWSVIILRDIVFCNRRTFNSILINNNENISSATLAKRLKRMCDLKLLSIFDDPTHSQRKIYSLTAKGMDLIPIIVELYRFGVKHTSPSANAVSLPENKKRPLSSFEEDLFQKLRSTHLNHVENAF